MKVLVVEDSLVVRIYVCNMLARQPDIELVPAAIDGVQAIEHALMYRPDLILMDLQLPELDGVDAIREIMSQCPCPIVVLSGHLNDGDRDRTFDAFQAGAVDVMSKPDGIGQTQEDAFHTQLTKTIRLMAQVKVVRRVQGRALPDPLPDPLPDYSDVIPPSRGIARQAISLVAIGSSMGGPTELFNLLQRIPSPLPVPVLISQHIAQGFAEGLCTWLHRSGRHTTMGRDGYRVRAGDILIAPDTHDMLIRPDLCIHLASCVDTNLTPNIDRMFMSVADSVGAAACGILLTGMGNDGARGLRVLRECHAMTIAQEPTTCVVDSMPSAAIALGAAERVLAPVDIAAYLRSLS